MKTISESILDWMEKYKRNSVKPATFDRLETSYKAMLHYGIAQVRLYDLRAEDIQTYINQLVRDGYALSTIKKQYVLLTAFLKFAYAQGIIDNPVYLAVNMPVEDAVKKPAKKIETYNLMEQGKLNRVLNTLDDRLYGAAILMLETGMRVGEVLALTWDDVNWDRRAISVGKTLVRLPNEQNNLFVQSSPKSKSSKRTIPLNNKAIDVLSRLAQETKGSEFIFYDDRSPSRPCTYDRLRFRLQAACEAAGVPYKGNHVFRHTFATNCYNRGCDVKILSKLLGHANVGITYNIYIRLHGDALEEMRSVVG